LGPIYGGNLHTPVNKRNYVGFEVITAAIMKNFYLLGYIAPKSIENHPTSACCKLHPGFLPGIYFDPEDGNNISFRNICCISTEYTALYPRRYNSSKGCIISVNVEGLQPESSNRTMFKNCENARNKLCFYSQNEMADIDC
jgi:hypothetical protein